MTFRPGRTCVLRASMLAVLVAAGLGPGAGAAGAAGCHVADRPEFGLDGAGEGLVGATTVRPPAGPARLGETPCSQELPGTFQTLTPLGAVGLLWAAPPRIALPSCPLTSGEPAPRPRRVADDPDPPPRSRSGRYA